VDAVRAEAQSVAQVAARVAASVLGGYAFVWGFVTAGIALLARTGMPYGEAQTALHLLAFLVYLACFCWPSQPRA
jgi:hypothetical protein